MRHTLVCSAGCVTVNEVLAAELYMRFLPHQSAHESEQLEPDHIHEFVVVVIGNIAVVAVEYGCVIGHKILLIRPNMSQRFAPNHRSDLSLLRDRAGRKTAFNSINGGVRHEPFQTKGRFELTDSYIRLWDAVPINENVGAGKSGATVGKTVALSEIAFHFKIELLGEIADQIDAGTSQTEAVLQRILAEATFECGDVTAFQIDLQITAQRQFEFRAARMHIHQRGRWCGEDCLTGIARGRFSFGVGKYGS